MSYVSPERSVSVDSYTHNANLFDPTKQYVCIRVWLPDGAPMKFLAESWNEGKEPDIENRPPSQVVEEISDKLEKAWIDTSREEKRKAIEWCRANAELLDRLWAEGLIRAEQRTIARSQKRIRKLLTDYLDTDDEPQEPTCDHGIEFDEETALTMQPHAIRKRWPRLHGECAKGCGFNGTAYASAQHFVWGGDWSEK
jgi:hypothetical protein